MIEIACHTVTWGRNLTRAFNDIRTLGFHGFESFAPAIYGGEAVYRAAVKESGLKVASIYTGGSFIYPEKTEAEIVTIGAVIGLLASLGSRHIVLGGGHKRPEGNAREDCEVMAGTLNRIGQLAQEHGLRACYHPHPGTCVHTGPEIERLMNLTDPDYVFLCPDTGHFLLAGADPVAYISKYLTRVGYVHLRDVGEDNQFLELGYGRVDLPGVLNVLRQGGYDGWLTIELDTTLRTPQESARICLEYLEKHGFA